MATKCNLCGYLSERPYNQQGTGCGSCEPWHWSTDDTPTDDEAHIEHLRAYDAEHAAEIIVSQNHCDFDYAGVCRIHVKRPTDEAWATFDVLVEMEPQFSAERVESEATASGGEG